METHFAAMEVQKKETRIMAIMYPEGTPQEKIVSEAEKYGGLIRGITEQGMESNDIFLAAVIKAEIWCIENNVGKVIQ